MNTKQFLYRPGYLSLALILLFQSFLCVPRAYALTGGPSQPEFTQFSTVSANNLVDPFSGNFQYSIPLFEIGGYPMSLNYSSDHKMEEEASWVGFGWSLSPGAISRDIRGVPDDFNGDEITRTTSMRDNITTGIKPGASYEIFGGFTLSAGLNFTYNNYTGFQFSRDLSPSINIMKVISGQGANNEIVDKNNPRTSLDDLSKATNFSFSIGTNINSRSGMQRIGFGASASRYFRHGNKAFGRGNSIGGGISFGGFTYTPVGQIPRQTETYTFSGRLGAKPGWPASLTVDLEGFWSRQTVNSAPIARPAYGYLYLQNAERDRNSIMDYNQEYGGIAHANSPRLPLAYGTPDVFQVTGSGIGGTIRIARNGVGVFRPPYNQTNSSSLSGGFELSLGGLIHPGFNIASVATTNTIGGWGNYGLELGFKTSTGMMEGAYMHFEGETGAHMGKNWYSDVGQDYPVRPEVEKQNGFVGLLNSATVHDAADEIPGNINPVLDIGSWSSRMRRSRANVVSYLTNEEVAMAGLLKDIEDYEPFEIGGNSNPSNLILAGNATSISERPGHHISEISITNTEGRRYVYGLPVYNSQKEEVSFNVSNSSGFVHPLDSDLVNQQSEFYSTVSYSHGVDDSSANSNGRDHYYDCTKTAPHISANLLTSVLSPDYV
ncbi:MAG: hypothetical protein AAFY91_09415, partial [Bacteroidota bacterium]